MILRSRKKRFGWNRNLISCFYSNRCHHCTWILRSATTLRWSSWRLYSSKSWGRHRASTSLRMRTQRWRHSVVGSNSSTLTLTPTLIIMTSQSSSLGKTSAASTATLVGMDNFIFKHQRADLFLFSSWSWLLVFQKLTNGTKTKLYQDICNISEYVLIKGTYMLRWNMLELYWNYLFILNIFEFAKENVKAIE